MTLEDYTTYKLILSRGLDRGRAEGETRSCAEGEAQGRAEEARALILLFGGNKFGDATARLADL